MKYEDLNFSDKAKVISIGVKNGLVDIESIKRAYNSYTEQDNKFDDGGGLIDDISDAINGGVSKIKKFLGFNPGGYTTPSGRFIKAGNIYEDPKTKLRYIVQEDGSLKRVHNFTDGFYRRVANNPNNKSQQLEDASSRNISKSQKTNKDYNIPWLDDKVIKIRRGTEYVSVPTNALDSLAKYSGMAGVSIEEGLGLAGQETNFGRIPRYNYGSKYSNGKRILNSTIHDMDYFHNFGEIPAEDMVRDFEVNGGLSPYTHDPILDIPPLLHAYQYYKSGRYNPGDKRHTKMVKEVGKEVLTSPAVQEWWEETGRDYYEGKRKAYGGLIDFMPTRNILIN